MSGTPVRQALRILESGGPLVPGSRRHLLMVDVSERHRSEIVAIRVAHEGAAAGEACTRVTPDDVDSLRLLTIKQHRSTEAEDAEAFLPLDEEFHRALAALAAMPNPSRLQAQLGFARGEGGGWVARGPCRSHLVDGSAPLKGAVQQT